MMQLTGGKAGGIRLTVPQGVKVRPTKVRTRRALCDSIGNWPGLTVVDLFAGAGTLGLEAASRGAARIYFVDRERRCCRSIAENIRKVVKAGVNSEFQVACGDALGVARRWRSLTNEMDLIIADPPYSDFHRCLDKLLNDNAFACWAGRATLLWECPDRLPAGWVPELAQSPWRVVKTRKFAGTCFLFMTGPRG